MYASVTKKLVGFENEAVSNFENVTPVVGLNTSAAAMTLLSTLSGELSSCSCNGFCGGNFRYEGCSCNGFCGSNSRKD